MEIANLNYIVNSLMKCGLCLETYQDPRILPCGHTFCLNCLKKQAVSSGIVQQSCGICRAGWKVPKHGVEKLTKNYDVNSFLSSLPSIAQCVMTEDEKKHGDVEYFCLDCWDPLCSICRESHKGTKLTKNHMVKAIGEINKDDIAEYHKRKTSVCSIHKNQDLILFCLKCKELVCMACCMTKHFQHNVKDLSEADKDFVQIICTSLDTLKSAVEERKHSLARIADEVKQNFEPNLKRRSEKTEIKELEDKVDKYQEWIERHEKYLKSSSSVAERAEFSKQLPTVLADLLEQKHCILPDVLNDLLSSSSPKKICFEMLTSTISQSNESSVPKSFTNILDRHSQNVLIEPASCNLILPNKELHSINSVELSHQFTVAEMAANNVDILSANNSELLISSTGHSTLYIYTLNGNLVSAIKISDHLCDAKWTANGHIICSTSNTHMVFLVSRSGEIIARNQMTFPQYLQVVGNNIYVADWEEGVFHSADGGYSWKNLFTSAHGWRMKQVLCVRNEYWTLEWSGAFSVRVYFQQGDDKFLWHDVGRKTSRGSFIDLKDSKMACDVYDNIFVTDFRNGAIHLFKASREYKCQLLSINAPWCLDIDCQNHVLIVGQSTGVISVYHLINK